MRLWRIFNPNYDPLSAVGSGIYGGRWNPKGCPVLYMGENLSLVAWERYVHIEAVPPRDLNLSATFIDLMPELIGRIEYIPNLDEDWREREYYTQQIGKEWVDSLRSPILRVPSVVVLYQYNYLVNPQHPYIKDWLAGLDPIRFKFEYDPRA
jgi:RES domain-containing protein